MFRLLSRCLPIKSSNVTSLIKSAQGVQVAKWRPTQIFSNFLQKLNPNDTSSITSFVKSMQGLELAKWSPIQMFSNFLQKKNDASGPNSLQGVVMERWWPVRIISNFMMKGHISDPFKGFTYKHADTKYIGGTFTKITYNKRINVSFQTGRKKRTMKKNFNVCQRFDANENIENDLKLQYLNMKKIGGAKFFITIEEEGQLPFYVKCRITQKTFLMGNAYIEFILDDYGHYTLQNGLQYIRKPSMVDVNVEEVKQMLKKNGITLNMIFHCFDVLMPFMPGNKGRILAELRDELSYLKHMSKKEREAEIKRQCKEEGLFFLLDSNE